MPELLDRPRRMRRSSAPGPWTGGELPASMELDLAAWLECYLADCEARGVSPRTLDWYRDRGLRIVSFLSAAGASYPSRVRRAEVSSFFSAIREHRHRGRPLSSQTILGYWAMGKGFFTFLIGEGAHPGPNPFDQFGKPIVREKAMWAPSTEQCAAMLKTANRRSLKGLRDLVVLYLMLDTGMRVSALTGLRVRDIDLAERRIRVIEKGQHERILPFGVQAMRWLRRYVISAHLQLEDPLFAGHGGKPISRKRIDESVRPTRALTLV